MDWDSHRYLECYFAVPMMGAVLQTVNVRLSPRADRLHDEPCRPQVLLVNTEFLPIVEEIKDQLETVRHIRPGSTTGREAARSRHPVRNASTRRCSRRARPTTIFPISTRTRAPPPFTRRARPACPRASISATASSCCTPSRGMAALASPEQGSAFIAATSICRSRRCSMFTPGACPMSPRCWASSRSIRAVTCPERLLELVRDEGVTFSHCVRHHPAHAAQLRPKRRPSI